jgi:hypothetical protein
VPADLPIRLAQAFRADVAFAYVLLRAELLVRLECVEDVVADRGLVGARHVVTPRCISADLRARNP